MFLMASSRIVSSSGLIMKHLKAILRHLFNLLTIKQEAALTPLSAAIWFNHHFQPLEYIRN